MKNASKKRSYSWNNGISFIIYPIFFFLVSALVVLIVLNPYISMFSNILDMNLLDKPPIFNQDNADIFKLAPLPPDEPDENGVLQPVEQPDILYSEIDFPGAGQQYGRLYIRDIGVDSPLFYGDDPKQLRKGVGTSRLTYLPGEGSTILMGGHNNTDFRNMKNVKEGMRVEIHTTYGLYVYEVTASQTGRFDNTDLYDLKSEEENLIMYTCVEWSSAGATPYRQFVYAKFISGPRLG